ncbi:hypothetical protein BH24PSE2_BH24PSE2_01730 [soil metagenome]
MGATSQYDPTGQLRQATDDMGRLRLILRYDPRGNVRLVQDGDERTLYRYAANGALAALSRPDGQRYAFETNADGQIIRVTDREERVTELDYLPTGRLEEIRFADGSSHSYGYEPVGLRAIIQPSDAKLLRTYYSASGNLTLLEHVSSSGAIQSDHYEYDETNRLNRIEYERPFFTGEQPSTAGKLTYDKAGEVIGENAPEIDRRFSYDAQDRLVGVSDGPKTLVYRYTEDEPDIRLQLDRETRINLLPWVNTGTTFGAAHELLNNRTVLAPYQVVYLDGEMTLFRLFPDIGMTLPNQAIEDSLVRMRLLTVGEADFDTKARFSRPSNIMFTPAEYRFINCLRNPPCWTNGIKDPPNGSSSLAASSVVEADLEACEDDDRGGGGNGGPACTSTGADTEATRWLSSITVQEPFERGAAILCNNRVATASRFSISGSDKCRVSYNLTAALAGAHTHPYFPVRGKEPILCLGRLLKTETDFKSANNANLNFSNADKQVVACSKLPLYMRTPSGSNTKVLTVDNVGKCEN